MGLFGQYPGTLFWQAGGPSHSAHADFGGLFLRFLDPGAELMQPTHLAASECAPHADGAHLTHSLPLLREGSIAE